MLNPILLAGASAIKQHQEQRIKEWTEKKGTSEVDFSHYISEIMDQWTMGDQRETSVDIDTFEGIEDIDALLSKLIQQKLKSSGILSDSGFINLTTITEDQLFDALSEFTQLTDDQKTTILTTIQAIQTNTPIDFETYTPSMFTFMPTDPSLQQYQISEDTSRQIWATLNDTHVLDEYGVLQLPPKSDELASEVYRLPGITDDQKERVLALLNRHPELSYHSYLDRFNSADDSDVLPKAGLYFANGVEMRRNQGLSKDELDMIKIIAVLEWNVYSISLKSAHKERTKSHAKRKAEKKENEKKDEEFYQKLRAETKRREQESKKQTKKKGG
jgi:hypothetical protein